MPLGITRLNQRHQHPTPWITFIKPLSGPGIPPAATTTAELFLQKVAAITHPLLAKHHISIMSLEEHEPNPEFIGRNFNHGEIIQLVLRTRSGGWLGFRQVVLVMMHEIAHCLHMNHSKDFWKVRDGFVGEMRKFWGRGYTGEGVWGVGRALQNGEVEDRSVELIGIDAVEEVCGGVYRRRRRKRKVDWKEQKERRVQKKFVAPAGEGRKMGGDEDERVKLEDGKKPKGNPRVAGSKRGRELRAQAALARFETNKVKEEEVKVEEEEEDEWEEEDEPAFDTDGSILRDTNGEEMVKIREEDENDIKIKDEMREMLGLSTIPLAEERSVSTSTSTSRNDSSTSKIPAPFPQTIPQRQNPYASAPIPSDPSSTSNTTNTQPTISHTSTPILPTEATIETETTCPICTLANPSLSWICIACSHVLRPEKSSGSWTCKRPECGSGGSQYRNAADCGLCGLCGGRRSEVEGDG